MSITSSTRPRLQKRTGAQNFNDLDRWVKPTEWINLPDISPTENKFAGIIAVFNNETNFVSINVTVSGGSPNTCTIDWGDGTTDEITNSGTVHHIHNWNDFDDTTLTADGFRQALITITANGGANITNINTDIRYAVSPIVRNIAYTVPWLMMKLSAPQMTSFKAGGQQIAAGTLQSIEILSSNMSSLYYRFQNLTGLCRLYLSNSASVTDARFALAQCYSLYDITLDITIASGCDGGNMFDSCYSMRKNPKMKFASNGYFWTLQNHFRSCYNLTEVTYEYPTENTSNFTSTFYSCYSLERPPNWNYSSGTTFYQMFYNCSSLKDFPIKIFDECPSTVSQTAFYQTFFGCSSIQKIPDLNFRTGSNVNATFQSCSAVESIGNLTFEHTDTLSKSWYRLFYNCYSLRSIGTITFTNRAIGDAILPANVNAMFYNCSSLKVTPVLDVTNVTNSTGLSNLVLGAYGISDFNLENARVSFTLNNLNLGPNELNNVYNSLATVTGQTITVTGNPGVYADDPSIATAKGWTVTG